MEQPPGSLGDLQPQDLSTSSLPAGIDLTRKGDECVLNSPSLDALHMVKSPSWYPNSGTSNPGLPFSETGSSETTLQSGEPVQPDNAFSHTTVTLSYVSRSHVFSSHNSLSRRSPLYSVPPISKLSLHSPCDLDIGLEETGYALNQHYLTQVDGPMDLATPHGGVCLTQKPQELISSSRDMGKHEKGEEDHSLSLKKRGGWEHGQGGSCSSSGVCAELLPETLTSATAEGEDRGSSEALSFTSKKRDPLVVSGSVGASDLSSQGREYISPLEDPVSPSAISLDNVEDVFVLPQASSSPSGDNSYLGTFDEVAWDGLRTERAIQPGCGISDRTTGLDSSAENEQPVSRRKAVLEPLIDLKDPVYVSDVSETKHKAITPHMNGNAKVLQRILKEKKLPVRPGRGTRLDTIVMNINSSRYKVSGCIRTGKKAKASQSPAGDSSQLASPKRNDTLLAEKRGGRVKALFSVKTRKQKAVSSMKRGQTNNINTDGCKDSTSNSEINHSKQSTGSTSPKSALFSLHKSKRGPEDVSHPAHEPQTSLVRLKRKPSSPSSPQCDAHKNSKEPEHLSHHDPSVEIHTARSSPPPSSKSPKKSKGKATSSKPSPTSNTKGAGTRKRRPKKRTWSPYPSIFSPKEPEIKLKYVNYKEEKRDYRLDGFSPFIRVECQQLAPSLCTIINYPEEVRTQHKRDQQQQTHPCGFISAVVPSTSCLQLGRVSTHSRQQRALICCLCGQAANAIDLGDLYGPYYPEGYQPVTKRPASMSGLKEDEDGYSDTDSSSCTVRGRGRKSAVPPTPRPLKPAAHLKQKVLESYRWTANNAGSPAAKRARSDGGSADVEDWYSPPVLPLEPCEYWLHEDCGIWSAGVFLVKGKVYGLEEAVKVAEETKCSTCSDHGATLGCFFKGCANKYHYRCALESDCVLVEEIFSMKCKKHKNKTFRAPPGNRGEDR